MWVKLSSEIDAEDLIELQRRGFVCDRYYEVTNRCNYDSYATYTIVDLINRDRIFAPIRVDFFEKPITSVKCINNDDREDKLTVLKTYKILDMGYTFGELWIHIKQDNDETGKYPLKRFTFVTDNIVSNGEKAEPLKPCEEEDNERNDVMSTVVGCVLGFGLGLLIGKGLGKLILKVLTILNKKEE